MFTLPAVPTNLLLVEIIVACLNPIFFLTVVAAIIKISSTKTRRFPGVIPLIMSFFTLVISGLFELGILLNIGFGETNSADLLWKCIGGLAVVMILTIAVFAVQMLDGTDS